MAFMAFTAFMAFVSFLVFMVSMAFMAFMALKAFMAFMAPFMTFMAFITFVSFTAFPFPQDCLPDRPFRYSVSSFMLATKERVSSPVPALLDHAPAAHLCKLITSRCQLL